MPTNILLTHAYPSLSLHPSPALYTASTYIPASTTALPEVAVAVVRSCGEITTISCSLPAEVVVPITRKDRLITPQRLARRVRLAVRECTLSLIPLPPSSFFLLLPPSPSLSLSLSLSVSLPTHCVCEWGGGLGLQSSHAGRSHTIAHSCEALKLNSHTNKQTNTHTHTHTDTPWGCV